MLARGASGRSGGRAPQLRRAMPTSSHELEPEPPDFDQAEGEQQVEGEPRADQVLLEGDEAVAEDDGDDLARKPQQQEEERRRACRRGRSPEGGGGAGQGSEREEGPQEPRPRAEEPVPQAAKAPGRVVDSPAGMLGRPRVVAAGVGAQPRHLGLDPRGDARQRSGIAGVEPEEAEAGQVGELGVDRVVGGDAAEDVAARQVAKALRDPDRGEGRVGLGGDLGDPGEDGVAPARRRRAAGGAPRKGARASARTAAKRRYCILLQLPTKPSVTRTITQASQRSRGRRARRVGSAAQSDSRATEPARAKRRAASP